MKREAGADPRRSRAQRFEASDEARSNPSIKDAETTQDSPGFASPAGLAALWQSMVERQSSRGRRFAIGVDGIRFEVFERDLERNLREISRKLLQRDAHGQTAYRFGPLARRAINTPSGKSRTVLVPRLRDQIVLRGMTQQIQENMRARGLSTAPPSLRTCGALIRRAVAKRGMVHALRADVASYFETIPHAPLLGRVNELGLHSDLVVLIERLLTAPFRDPLSTKSAGDKRSIGIPPGVSISSVLGELYLSPLDDSIRAIGVFFLRYVDDILVLTDSTEKLAEARIALDSGLSDLGLSSSREKTWQGSVASDLVFLGLRISAAGIRIDPPRLDRWLLAKRRRIRIAAQEIDRQPDLESKRTALAAFVLELNREISGLTGRMVPFAAGASDLASLGNLDTGIRTALGGVFRRCDTTPSGRFRIARAVEWGHRWRRSPRSARDMALRDFGQAVTRGEAT